MEPSKLVPFLRQKLDILFIGLNPAKGSSENGHYFSVKQEFWNQLHISKLINQPVDKSIADQLIFGNNNLNYNQWQYGITDLVTEYAESNSGKIIPTIDNCKRLKSDIQKFNPKTAILLHSKVLNYFLSYLNKSIPISNTGALGKLLENCQTEFFNIAFPHGNTITSLDKIRRYKEVHERLLKFNS